MYRIESLTADTLPLAIQKGKFGKNKNLNRNHLKSTNQKKVNSGKGKDKSGK